MSPLYCLLRSGDDNFKAQILFVGGGGRMEAVWDGPELPRLGFSPVCMKVCGVFGASSYTQPLQGQQREAEDSYPKPQSHVATPHSNSLTPTPSHIQILRPGGWDLIKRN